MKSPANFMFEKNVQAYFIFTVLRVKVDVVGACSMESLLNLTISKIINRCKSPLKMPTNVLFEETLWLILFLRVKAHSRCLSMFKESLLNFTIYKINDCKSPLRMSANVIFLKHVQAYFTVTVLKVKVYVVWARSMDEKLTVLRRLT